MERKILGQKIKEARKRLNLSQEDLAGDIFTKSYISKIERGFVNPSMKALEAIVSRLNMPISHFISDKDDQIYDPGMLLEAQKLFELRKYKESLCKLNEILAYKEYIDAEQLIRIYYYITDLCIRLEDYDACVEYYGQCAELLKNADSVYAAKLHLELGEAYYYLNKRQDSLDIFLKVEKLINQNTLEIDIITRLELYNDIAILYSQLGKTQLGKDYFKKVIEISKKYKIITSTVLSAFAGLAQISVIYERDANKSLSYLNNDVLSLYKYFEDYTKLGEIYLKYSNAYYEKDDLDKFKEYLLKLEDTIPLIADSKAKAELETYLILSKGKLMNREGIYNEAELMIRDAMKRAEKQGDLIAQTSVYLNLGSLYLNMDKLDEALKNLIECEQLSNEIQFSIRLPELYQLMGKVYIKLGNVSRGQEYYDKAFRLLKSE